MRLRACSVNGAVIGSRGFVEEVFRNSLLRAEAQGRREADAGKWRIGSGCAVEHARFAGEGVKFLRTATGDRRHFGCASWMI